MLFRLAVVAGFGKNKRGVNRGVNQRTFQVKRRVAPTDERSALATMMRQSARPPHGTAPKCTTRRVMERRKEHPVPAPTATPRSRVTTARVTHDTSESSAPEPPDAPKEASQCLTDTSTTTRAPDERNVKRSSDIPT